MRKKNLPPKKDSEDNRTKAFNYSIKYLSYRQRSVKEVFEYLKKKNFNEDTINAILKKLIDLKFLNDEEFGRQWIESRQKYKGKSKLVLTNELRIKGLDSSLIQKLLSESQDDLEVALKLFEKKKKIYGKLPPDEFRKKMGGFLQRRGFSWNTIKKTMNGD